MKKILTFLFLLTVFCALPLFAQEKSANEEKLTAKLNEIKTELFSYNEDQCEAFGKYDFEGTPVSFELVDADIQDVLNFANPFGCNFVIDETVKKAHINTKVNDFSWNLALRSVLKSLDLVVKIEDSNFRIVKSGDSYYRSFLKPEPDYKALYTEFVKLNYLVLQYDSICFPNKMFGKAKFNDPDKFLNFLRKMVSSRGAIEVDIRKLTIIITDEKDRVKKIAEFVKLLDESGYTTEEIVNNPNLEIK